MIDDRFLSGRRFAVRFLGRPHTWIWLAAGLVVGLVAWWLMAVPGRGEMGFQRSWYLWSGNVVAAMFTVTLLFSLRKWSMKLDWVRNLGRVPSDRVDACWAAMQKLNREIAKGAYGSDAQIVEAAEKVLVTFGVEKVQRVELLERPTGAGKPLKYVRMGKRDPLGRLEPWLEMHMGLGTAACIGVILHADFVIRHPVGWVLFLGSMIVLLTGIVGAVLYRAAPAKLAAADAGIPFEEAGVARESYQSCVEGVIGGMDPDLQPELAPLVQRSASAAQFGQRAEQALGRVAAKRPEHVEIARDVVVMAGSRDHLDWATARARSIDFQLKLWRWIHVPVSVFLCFVIVLHVVLVLWF